MRRTLLLLVLSLTLAAVAVPHIAQAQSCTSGDGNNTWSVPQGAEGSCTSNATGCSVTYTESCGNGCTRTVTEKKTLQVK